METIAMKPKQVLLSQQQPKKKEGKYNATH